MSGDDRLHNGKWWHQRLKYKWIFILEHFQYLEQNEGKGGGKEKDFLKASDEIP